MCQCVVGLHFTGFVQTAAWAMSKSWKYMLWKKSYTCTKSSKLQTGKGMRVSSDGEGNWGFDRFNLKRCGAIRLGEGGRLETQGQYSQTSFYNKYIFNLCSFINQQNHFKMNSTLLSLLVALTVLYHEFVSVCNSSPAILHTKYVLYEPSFIMACQLLTVSLFSLEL